VDEAFLYERTIDIDTYDRQGDKLREELTIVSRFVARSKTAAAAGVFPRRRSLQWKEPCWNRHNPAGFQRLEPCFEGEK
jgi:hypothetical protein